MTAKLRFQVFIPFLLALAACQPGESDSSGPAPKSAADFVETHRALAVHMFSEADFVKTYPERAAYLFSELDLDRPGLREVAAAVERGNLVSASERLLTYYRASNNGSWLRNRVGVHDPGGFDDDVVALADGTLDDVYLLQGVRGQAKRTAEGGIDWLYQGPNEDREWTLFVNRHFVLLALQKAYRENKKSEYIQYINAFLIDWTAANSPAAEAADEYGLPSTWQPMSTASRLLQVWPQLFYYFQDEATFSPAARLMMLASIPEQADHLQRYHRSKHNHAVKEMAGLGHAAAAWPEFRDAAEWSEYATATLGDEIVRQVYPDGVQKELSSHYHRNVLEYVAQYLAFSDAAGIELPSHFVSLIESMAHYLARTMKPDGHIILNNNGDLDFVRDKLVAFADQFQRPDWRYIASYGAAGAEPEGLPSSYFPYAGHLISRSGWSEDAHWSYFDIGPWGISHQHNDRLHLSLHAGPRNLLVDTGRVNYIKDDPIRTHILSSAAHNVILIDGRDQGPQVGERERPAEGAALLHADYDFAVGSLDDGFPDLEGTARHTRALFYRRGGYWLVVDRIETDRPRQLEALWHLHPDVSVRVESNPHTVTTDGGQANLRIEPVGGLRWEADLVSGQKEPAYQGWYSPVYNTVLPAPTAVYRTSIDETAIFAWLISVGRDRAPDLAIDVEASSSSELRVRIDTQNGVTERISVRLDGDELRDPNGNWLAQNALLAFETVAE